MGAPIPTSALAGGAKLQSLWCPADAQGSAELGLCPTGVQCVCLRAPKIRDKCGGGGLKMLPLDRDVVYYRASAEGCSSQHPLVSVSGGNRAPGVFSWRTFTSLRM